MRSLVMAAALLLFGASAQADGRPVLVELFTSQGCSSCPAADSFMEELVRTDGVVALTYPVDIWDYLGWRDTLAAHEYSVRQQTYAPNLPSRSVYTPQMVIGGIPVFAGFALIGHPPDFTRLSATAWIATLYSATVPMVFCHYAWTRLVGLVPAGVAAISTLMIPVVGVLSSAPLVGEPIGARDLLALALVVSALVVVLLIPHLRRKPAAPGR